MLSILKVVVVSASYGWVSMFAQIDFKGTITLGSIITGMLIAALAGLYTIRVNTAKVWRQNYEGEKERADNTERDLLQLEKEHLAAIEDQQEVRHQLKGELAEAKAIIKVLEARPDFTQMMQLITAMSDSQISVVGVLNDIKTALVTLVEGAQANGHTKS